MEETIIIIFEIFILLGIGCIFIFRKFLFSYSTEKGKNLATRENIEEITDKIENVKLDYARQLEAARAELSSQINTHGFRYEKEYEVLSDLTGHLVDVRNASLNLRPVFDFVDPNKTKDEIKRERLQAFYETRRKLFFVREKKRPFYPDEIYQAVLDIDKAARSESIDYEYGDPFKGDKIGDYWDKAKENQEDIVNKTNIAMENIRERVNKWEDLSGGL